MLIPSNDDAIRAVKLLVGKIADAVIEGRASRKDEFQEEPGTAEQTQRSARVSAAPRVRMEEESTLEDTALLGESTLAKLGGKVELEEEK